MAASSCVAVASMPVLLGSASSLDGVLLHAQLRARVRLLHAHSP